MERVAWSSGQKFLAGPVQISRKLVPGVVLLGQTPRAAAAVGQLGVAATHECNKRIGHGINGNLAFPSAALGCCLGKMTGIGGNDRKFAG